MIKNYRRIPFQALLLLAALAVIAIYGNSATSAQNPTPVIGNGTGLTGRYYAGTNLLNEVLKRNDATVNFDLQYDAPAPGVPADGFSARWTGFVQPKYSENYTFYTASDDGVRVWVNGVKIIDNWTDHGRIENTGSMTLAAAAKYSIKIEYYDNLRRGVITLYWSSATQGKEIIPMSQLYPEAAGGKMFGVNLSGAEFGTIPGTQNKDYIYPNNLAEYKYFAGQGMELVRIPITWERVQRNQLGDLSRPDIDSLKASVDLARQAGQKVILDLHNYGLWNGKPLTSSESDRNALADVWLKLAREFKDNPTIYGYELMNEPHDMPMGADGWASEAQYITNVIRGADTGHYVIVPGYDWQSSLRWPTSNPHLNVSDPAGKILYSAHVYFDNDQSGSYNESYDKETSTANVGADRLDPFVNWLKSKNAQGIITEYGIPDNDARWLTVLDKFLAKINSIPEIVGGTYWAAGPWWGTYPLSAEPRNGIERPQMSILKKY